MLRSLKTLESFTIGATDGAIGKVNDFYFDDQAWTIRYIVVDTGSWLGGREVLISPYGVGTPDWSAASLPVDVTKAQVKASPGIDSDKPISRQYERSYLGYYGYPYYWGGVGVWGASTYPGTPLNGMVETGYRGYLTSPSEDGDPHLRSCEAVKGYHVHASDGDIGHVQGFIIDDYTWSIRYLILNTSNWWVGHQVLVSPEWIEEISWGESKVITNLTRAAIMASPAYDGAAIDRDAELSIYKHYDRDAYWQENRTRHAA
jgi:uncharacterized protein YrrD